MSQNKLQIDKILPYKADKTAIYNFEKSKSFRQAKIHRSGWICGRRELQYSSFWATKISEKVMFVRSSFAEEYSDFDEGALRMQAIR